MNEKEFPKLLNKHDGTMITVNNLSFSIGRSLSCDHIIQSLGVSRFHCIIKKDHDKWFLFDRSTNGTCVNSKLYKFNENVNLKDGDVIKLGPENLDYLFTCGSAADAVSTGEQENMTAPGGSVTTNQDCHEMLEDDVVEEFQKPFQAEVAAATTQSQPRPAENLKEENQNLEMMEDELTCSICSELFIRAVTLNCSHTFCKFCINKWKKNKSSCPICRKHIKTVAPTLVLDNYIEKIINTRSEEVKETRKTIVRQREEAIINTAGSSKKSNDLVQVIEIFSENDDDDEHEEDQSDLGEDSDYNDYSDEEDNDMYDCYLDGRPSPPYYGGYGRCFICNQAGHWANTCPFKRR